MTEKASYRSRLVTEQGPPISSSGQERIRRDAELRRQVNSNPITTIIVSTDQSLPASTIKKT